MKSFDLQLSVFKAEKAQETSDPFECGGSNRSILNEKFNSIIEMEIYEHPVYLLQDRIDGIVDILKRYFFKIHFWVSIAIVFLAGTYSTDIFSLGYIGMVFVFLWLGNEFYMKPLKTILKWWNALLIYNVCVIIIKIAIEIFGCHLSEKISVEFCWTAEIVGLPCSNKKLTNNFCNDWEKKRAYLSDAIVFATIILQRRIFNSYYFFNVINETFTTLLLASRFVMNFDVLGKSEIYVFINTFRGAEMLEELYIQERNKEIVEEAENLENLKKKMDLIKKSAHVLNVERKQPMCHDHAIRSGGYYMFDEEEQIEDESLLKESELGVDEKNDSMSHETKKIVKFQPRNSFSEVYKSIVVEKSETARKFCSAGLLKIMQKMHKLSRNYSFIIRSMAREKKMLKENMTPAQLGSHHDL